MIIVMTTVMYLTLWILLLEREKKIISEKNAISYDAIKRETPHYFNGHFVLVLLNRHINGSNQFLDHGPMGLVHIFTQFFLNRKQFHFLEDAYLAVAKSYAKV